MRADGHNFNIRNSKGFSLMELLFVIFILGIVLQITDFGGIAKIAGRSYASKQEIINKNIANALLQHAKTNTALGQLPAPYTGSSFNSTIYDPANTQLAQLMRSANIAVAEINNDGTTAENVRVYQNVTLTQPTPLYFQSGPLTILTYQFGEVHMTACQKLDAACNTAGADLPGPSTTLTSANYTTWATISPDLKAELFSTLPMQKQMLAQTAQRLADLRDRLSENFRTKQLSAAADDTTNWHPYPYAAGVPGTPLPNKSGLDPLSATGQDCRDGWYDLNAANINILAQLGLSQTQFGTTAWGGAIEYCRDYDPGNRGAGALPHFAALRINKSVSLGSTPDASLKMNNVFITF